MRLIHSFVAVLPLRLRLTIGSAAVICALLTTGCATLAIDLPGEFLVLPDSDDGMRATTPDEARVWVRELTAPPGAEIAFWQAALKRDLVSGRGYTILEENTVKDASGRKGVELLCEGKVSGIPHRYLLTVFVVPTPLPMFFDDTIRTIEYGADKDAFDQHLAAVRKGIAALQ